ncbi:MAG: hypothetical protein JNJ85_11660 [Candidatus Kapabacteria bacterium]|nr:hypothetical protein [Candidatus Kapabacteria bacterium]MBX7155540.1 hypothetical protein [Bacteroidota bacterium]
MRIIPLFLLLMLSLPLANLQANIKIDPLVLLRGNVKDNNKGVAVDMQFKDESGAIVKSKSASDGTYQAILKPGHKYQLTITDENLTRYTFTYEVPNYDKYTQLDQDFPLNATKVDTPVATESPKKSKKNKSKKTKKGK